MIRRDTDKNANFVEESKEVSVPDRAGVETASEPIKIGVHVKYNNKEYVVQDVRGNEILIVMGDEEHTVEKSEVKVIR